MADLIIKESDLSEQIKQGISIALGWTEQIEDVDAEIIGDNYPLIDNPISRDVFLSMAIAQEIKSTIIQKGRQTLIDEAQAKINKVNHGEFDKFFIPS